MEREREREILVREKETNKQKGQREGASQSNSVAGSEFSVQRCWLVETEGEAFF